MKELPRVPGTRILCPEDCRYRNKRAPFCGYCLPEVLKKLGSDKERMMREMIEKTTDKDSIAQMNEAIDIGDMDELKERVREMPEKTIYRVVFGEGATGNEQKDG